MNPVRTGFADSEAPVRWCAGALAFVAQRGGVAGWQVDSEVADRRRVIPSS